MNNMLKKELKAALDSDDNKSNTRNSYNSRTLFLLLQELIISENT